MKLGIHTNRDKKIQVITFELGYRVTLGIRVTPAASAEPSGHPLSPLPQMDSPLHAQSCDILPEPLYNIIVQPFPCFHTY